MADLLLVVDVPRVVAPLPHPPHRPRVVVQVAVHHRDRVVHAPRLPAALAQRLDDVDRQNRLEVPFFGFVDRRLAPFLNARVPLLVAQTAQRRVAAARPSVRKGGVGHGREEFRRALLQFNMLDAVDGREAHDARVAPSSFRISEHPLLRLADQRALRRLVLQAHERVHPDTPHLPYFKARGLFDVLGVRARRIAHDHRPKQIAPLPGVGIVVDLGRAELREIKPLRPLRPPLLVI
mmetsp:Transcript_11706/g.30575  ORF Transcript_11706/g.30575 Transcript_11706/m.30575 type:complete len:236 (+) Transcript_11706:1545-2252(+)